MYEKELATIVKEKANIDVTSMFEKPKDPKLINFLSKIKNSY